MILENIQNIKERIAKACKNAGRDPESVSLIAVSKTFGPEYISEAIQAGHIEFGENYVQELLRKRDQIPDPRIRWHYIGHLQTNKVKYIADWIVMIHSVDSIGLAEEINKRAMQRGRKIDVLVEVNTSHEESKFGVAPERAVELVKEVGAFPHLSVRGLMTIGPFLPDAEASRPSFRMLRELQEASNRSGVLPVQMDHLSMGMTNDFEIAVQEGATMVRIGTAIFGSRK